MTAREELRRRREVLLIDMHVQRQLLLSQCLPVDFNNIIHARSATMRFILSQPRFCVWAVVVVLPRLLGRIPGRIGKGFHRAFSDNRLDR